MLNKLEESSRLEKELPEFLKKSQLYSIVITNMSGYYIYVNEVFKQRFSFIATDFIGVHSFETIHPDDHGVCLQAVNACIAQPDKTVQVKLRKPAENKEDYYWTNWEFSVLFNTDKTPLGILCIGYDVSENVRTQNKLVKIVRKLDSLIEEITDSFIQLDRAWNIIKCNSVTSKILDSATEELTGKKLWDLLPGLPNFDFEKAIGDASGKNSQAYNYYHEKLGKWFSVILYPAQDGYNIFLRDITAEYLLQKKIKESEHKLKAIINSTNDSNLLINAHGELMNYNKAAKESFFNYFHKDLEIGRKLKELLPSEAAANFEIYFPRALQGEKSSFEVERVINGKSFWFEVTYSPVFDEAGDLIGVSKNTVNITEKKLSMMKVEEQERILRFMYESTTDACSFIDRDLRFRYLNKASHKLSKMTLGKKANIGDMAIDYVLPAWKAEFQQFFISVLDGAEVNVERFDGNNWWQVAMKPVYDNTQQILGISQNIRNITQKKRTELKLVQQNEILRGIAYQQSHELRRPVAAILGLCELIKHEISGSNTELSKLIENLSVTVQEMDDSIRKAVQQVNAFEQNEQ
jgi:PAS domain S-box-containing protein